MKRVNAYSNRQASVHGYRHAEPGLAMRFRGEGVDTDEMKQKMFGAMSSMFSIGVFEKRDDVIELRDGEG